MTPTTLAGRKVLVTGGARGIGAAICRSIATHGGSVVVNDLSGADAFKLAAELKAQGHVAHAVEGDVSRAADTERLFSAAAGAVGGIDGLVNNAGRLCRGRLIEFEDDEWDRTLAVNATGVYRCLKLFARECVDQGRQGSIVNIASMSYRGMTQQIAYVASKGAVVSMTRAAALVLAPHGIRVNAVAPGMTETAMTQATHGSSAFRDAMTSRVPAGRYGQPDEIADAVTFLLTDSSTYITGEVLHVAGGLQVG